MLLEDAPRRVPFGGLIVRQANQPTNKKATRNGQMVGQLHRELTNKLNSTISEYLHGVEEVLDVGTRTDFVVKLVELVERPVVRLDNIILNICAGNG